MRGNSMKQVPVEIDSINVPLVARFGALRIEIEDGDREAIYASGRGIFGSDPTTYSPTTSRGDDNDSDDTGSD